MPRISVGKALVSASLALVLSPILIIGCAGMLNFRTASETNLAKSVQLKSPPQPLKDPVDLKIITFNCHDLYIASDHRPERLRAIGETLAELDPDIVGLQEAFIKSDREVLLNALDAQDSRLIFRRYFPSATVGSGLMILSAFPLSECFFHRYERNGKWYRFQHGDWWAGKGVALARVWLPGDAGYIDFYNTHIHANYGRGEYVPVIEAQAHELAAFIKASATGTSPAIVIGDFNARPDAQAYAIFTTEATLTRRMSFDTPIDHIFSVDNPRYEFETLDTVPIDRKITIGGQEEPFSDHTGYMTTLRITPKAKDL